MAACKKKKKNKRQPHNFRCDRLKEKEEKYVHTPVAKSTKSTADVDDTS